MLHPCRSEGNFVAIGYLLPPSHAVPGVELKLLGVQYQEAGALTTEPSHWPYSCYLSYFPYRF